MWAVGGTKSLDQVFVTLNDGSSLLTNSVKKTFILDVRPNAVTLCYILSAFNRVEDC